MTDSDISFKIFIKLRIKKHKNKRSKVYTSEWILFSLSSYSKGVELRGWRENWMQVINKTLGILTLNSCSNQMFIDKES